MFEYIELFYNRMLRDANEWKPDYTIFTAVHCQVGGLRLDATP